MRKPIVIYLDFHSDARRLADAPHSGTWISECYDLDMIEKTYCIGLSLLANNDQAMDNMDKHGVSY